MVQIDAHLTDRPKQHLKLTLADADLSFEAIMAAAKKRAKDTGADPMLLSWHSGKTGRYWPKTECGAGGKDPWIVYAESRGCNLTVDVNNGDYVFYYLLI